MERIADNKRAARNALMLAIRMVIVTLVGLYTARIVLKTLGVSDYGVYGVAGGFIGVIAFLNTSMAGATNRFLCIEMGRSSLKNLNSVFSSALLIHMGIAAVVVLLAETVGLWFLNFKLNIPADRMDAANWVYQCSILTTVISITQTPYSAVILAREKMNIYAYFEIINVALKLLVVYLLICLPGDKLITYSILVTISSLLMRMMNRLYCIKNFKESHFNWRCEKAFFRDMLKFSATDMYGNICYITYEQSRAIVLNIFFGVVFNAAASLAYNVQSIVSGFASTTSQAFRPQILKLYAAKEIETMQNSMTNALKANVLLFTVMAVPCIFEAPFLLDLWLGSIPPHLVLFLRIILITSVVAPLSGTCCSAIHATGHIKSLSYITGTLYLCIPVISWIAFSLGADAWWMFVIYGIVLCFITLVDVILVKVNIPDFRIRHFIKKALIIYLVAFSGAIPVALVYVNFQESFLRFILTSLTYITNVALFTWVFLMNSDERRKIADELKTKTKGLMR